VAQKLHILAETAPHAGRYKITKLAHKGLAKPPKEGFGKMNRIAFNSPFLLGFDHIERLLERTAKGDGYPPYNIEELDDGRIRISLAVAGFAADELGVTVEDHQLVIRGQQTEPEDRTFLHRGIASRQFQRSFVLAEGIEVVGAELKHGLLCVELQRPRQEAVVKTIPIRSGEVHTRSATKGPE
jgi:HSP20 family molecular chaperone IbpA